MKIIQVDAQLAKLFRWIVLPLGIAATVFGAVLMPLSPGAPDPRWTEYLFRLSPLCASALLLLLAAWLRTQEAADPAVEGSAGRSFIRNFVIYVAVSITISGIAGAVVYR